MSDQEIRQAIDRIRQLFEQGDMAGATQAQMELASEDMVQEWPQSGERISGRANVLAVTQNYEGATGTSPQMKLRRITGSGNVWVVESTIDYGDGNVANYVGISEFRDGKVAKLTEYFANPFPAPEWRAQWVERIS